MESSAPVARPPNGRRGIGAPGFTLIEALIVVVLIGVLAVIATVAYRRWVHTSYMTEAQDMVSSIRAAQESFRAENGGYLNVSTGLGPGNDYPLLTPGKSKTGWGGTCTGCVNTTTGWSALNVSSSAPVIFGYSTIASNTNGVAPNNLAYRGGALDFSSMATPWYVVEADGDVDGNGIFCNVYGLSGTNQIYINNEAE
jgi:prepilin-type N-terminal cleavage/methylation domain-containing protein